MIKDLYVVRLVSGWANNYTYLVPLVEAENETNETD